HRGGDESYEAVQAMPITFRVSVFGDDLKATTFEPDLDVEGGRMFLGSDGQWYFVGRPVDGEALRLWRLDEANGYEPTAEWELPGTEVLRGMLHTLRPDRFGGDDDGDIVHLATSDIPGVPFGDYRDRVGLVYARFDLPVGE
ncbi:MAG: hypothetical protein ACYTFO_07130, partial [Planctomycetota bacterium]